MTREELKNRVIKAIDENRESIIQAGRDIYKTPELGFKEFKSTARTSKFLKELGLDVEENIAVTGCKSVIDSGLDMSLDNGLKFEAEVFGAMFSTADQKEGMDAFVNKRKPNFTKN